MFADQQMLIEERDSLQRQLRQYRKTLLRLQEQRANYGLNVPLEILNGIDNAQEQIERIEARLRQVSAELDELAAGVQDIAPELPKQSLSPQDLPPPPPAQPAIGINPYALRAIIKDPAAFVGRSAELHDLYTLLAAMQSCSIVGPRRIGKSSLLYYLAQPSVYSIHLPDPSLYAFAFLDLQELAGLGPDDFCLTAVERLVPASQGRLNLDPQHCSMSGFRRFLRQASDLGLRLVLCCDEFEMLSQNANFGPDFFTVLRGLCSNYNLALVTSSRVSLFDLCHLGNLQTSQFWNIFIERTLGLMPEDEAKTLIKEPFINAGGTITNKDIAFVLKLAGRHPFFIQIACYHLFQSRLTDDPIDFSTVERRFHDEAYRHYAYAWKQLSEPEQATLATLAQTEGQQLKATSFQALKRNALVTGSPTAPALVSEGWRYFLKNQEPTAPPHQSSLASSRPLSSSESETNYDDFELKVEHIDATSCRVLVLDSPAGQDSVLCQLPFSLDTVGSVMVDLGQQIARGTATQSSDQPNPTAIGQALFQSIFSGPVSHLFFESMGRAHSQGQGLRIKIHVDPEKSPQLAALPWEFLYNDRRRSFLALNRLTPIVRYLDVQAPTDRPQLSLPLRVLVVIASPVGLPPLDLPGEQELIRQAWGSRPEVSVQFLNPATPSALQAKLWDWQPHVLHFMGHGHFDTLTGAGALLFVDHQNQPKPIVGAQLGVLLSNAPSVRLAFLNACQSAELSRSSNLDPFSGVAAALVIAGLPAVVAMQFPISDQAALAFANGFYPRLAAGEAIELAVSFGRETIRLELNDNQEWGTPVLFIRVSNGHLFDIGGREQQPGEQGE